MTINQGVQPKRAIKGRQWRETRVRESAKLGAGSTNFKSLEFQLRTSWGEKYEMDVFRGCLKFHIHISGQIWCTFMVSKRKTLFHVLLCYAFFIGNAISNPIRVFRIHVGRQRFLEFTRWGNIFDARELLMSQILWEPHWLKGIS